MTVRTNKREEKCSHTEAESDMRIFRFLFSVFQFPVFHFPVLTRVFRFAFAIRVEGHICVTFDPSLS